MISYSPRSAGAIAFLKAPVNDVDVFVEDTSKTRAWLALVRSCLPSGLKLTSVTALHGRDAVIEACRLDNEHTRIRIDIIDGDFDYILHRRKPRCRRLVRIPAYCLEGLALNRRGLKSIIEQFRPDLDSDQTVDDFFAFLDLNWAACARRLFGRYALNHVAAGQAQTASYHIARLSLAGKRPFRPDSTKVRTQLSNVLASIIAGNPLTSEVVRSAVMRAQKQPLVQVVSGKTYLLPILVDWLRTVVGLRLNSDDLLVALLSRAGCVAPQIKRQFAA